MTIAPALMSLLDKVTDPMPAAISEASFAIDYLRERIYQLKSAKDKNGDCRESLQLDADLAMDALEALVELIEEKTR